MNSGFRDDVHVEAVAEIDGVDVVAFEVGVHDGEEDLQEEVDGVEEDGEQEEPCFARHRGGCVAPLPGAGSLVDLG